MNSSLGLSLASTDNSYECLHDLFLRNVEDYPDHPCIEEEIDGKTNVLSYRDVDKASTELGCVMVKKLPEWDGHGDKPCVAILLAKCSEEYIAMIASLKIGRAYVSIDPTYPLQRAQFIADDSGSACLVTKYESHHQCPVEHKGGAITLDSEEIKELLTQQKDAFIPEDHTPHPDDLCYMIYTSGTTGNPKGVEITHRAAVNFVKGEEDIWDVKPTDRVLQGFSTCFDASVEEIWSLAFSKGACLVVATGMLMKSGPDLPVELHRMGITIWSTVPTLLRTLMDQSSIMTNLRMLISGGEALTPEIIDVWGQGREFWNTYGPTEATVVCVARLVKPGDRSIPIGKALKGYTSYVLDPEDTNKILGQDQLGELVVGGPSLARGYRNLPKKTADAFIMHPELGRLYRTGDLVVLDANGEYMYQGRIDAQVKIRGYRVELSAIEHHICEVERVKGTAAAVVQQKLGGDTVSTLIAVVAADPDMNTASSAPSFSDEYIQSMLASIHHHIATILPAFMIPVSYAFVEAIPILPSGKTDRKGLQGQLDRGQLPLYQRKSTGNQDVEIVAFENELESKVGDIWKDLLQVQEIGRAQNFFDLGGHSMTAAKTIGRLRALPEFKGVSVRDLYTKPTIAELCDWASIHQASGSVGYSSPASSPRGHGPTFFESQDYIMEPDAKVQGNAHWFICLVVQTLWIVFLLGFWISIPVYFALICQLHLFNVWWNSDPTSEALQLTSLGYIVYALALGAALGFYLLVANVTLSVVVKWVLLGRMKSGKHRVWSFYYLRYWMAKVTCLLVPQVGLRGTPFLNFYATLMGADIGKNVYIGTHTITFWNDLITLADGACIGQESNIITTGYMEGVMICASVHVGKNSILHPRAVLSRGVYLSENCEHLSLESARPFSVEGRPLKDQLGLSKGYSWWTPVLQFLLLLMFVFLNIFVQVMALTILFLSIWAYTEDYWCLAGSIVVIAPLVTILSILWVVPQRWIVLGSMTAKSVPIGSLQYLRWWYWELLESYLSQSYRSVYATTFTPMFLRLFGMKIGPECEISTIFGWNPNTVVLVGHCFLADHVCLGAPVVKGGVLSVEPVAIDSQAFVGNNAVVETGSIIGGKSLTGVLSRAPKVVTPGTNWLGAPAFALSAKREGQKEKFKDSQLYSPSGCMQLARACFEMVKICTFGIIASLSFFTWYALVLYPLIQDYVSEEDSIIDDVLEVVSEYAQLSDVLLVSAYMMAFAVFAVLFVIVAKWIAIGQFKAGAYPLYSTYVWRAEMIAGWEESLAPFTTFLCGTPWLSWIYTLLGATIGSKASIWSLFLTEPDLINIGDGVVLGEGSTIQTHLFEDRVMKMNHLRIGNNCSIGNNSVVLYGANMENGVSLGDSSLCMKGETLIERTHYVGCPADPIHIPSPPLTSPHLPSPSLTSPHLPSQPFTSPLTPL